MLRPSRPARRTALAAGAAASAAALVLAAAVPAGATPDGWPLTGWQPTDCASISWNESLDTPQYTYTDTELPKVTSVGFNVGNPAILGPGTVDLKLAATVVDTCSGVGSVETWLRRGKGPLEPLTMKNEGTDAFTGTWTVGSTSPASADDAGVFELPLFRVADRYDSFTLTAEYGLIAHTDSTRSGYAQAVAPTGRNYLVVLRQSQLTAKPTKPSVPRGTTLAIGGVVQFARQTGWVPYPNATVQMFYRYGRTGSFRAGPVVKASTGGTVSIPFKPAATAQVKLVTKGERGTGTAWVAAGESAPVTVTVTAPKPTPKPGSASRKSVRPKPLAHK